jgi:hypothetical protein
MAKGRVSFAGIVAVLLFGAFASGTEIISGAGALLTRPDGTMAHNAGTLVLSGNTVTVHDLDTRGGGITLASTYFRDGLGGKSIEEQFRAARAAVLAYRGLSTRERHEALEQCERGVQCHTPWGHVLGVSIIAGESRTTTIRDPSGAATNVSTKETPVTLVESISIQYGISCCCYDGPCTCTKFLAIRVVIMTSIGPCVFDKFMRIGPPIPCS